MNTWIGVLGTWADSEPGDAETFWWEGGSPFHRYMSQAGWQHLITDYHWSGKLSGLPFVGRNVWPDAGAALARRLERHVPLEHRNLIAHSHGGQVVIHAAQQVALRSVVFVGTPARRQEEAMLRAAMRHGVIGAAAHMLDDTYDRWGLLGAAFDGRVRFSRYFDVPGVRVVKLDQIGHSKVLNQPDLMHLVEYQLRQCVEETR